MNKIFHPSDYIDSRIINTIRNFAAAVEQTGTLHPLQLSLIYEQHWFKLFVPRALGGLELSLPEGLKIEESLAWADGSTGWTVTLCSGANWFIGFINPAIVKDIFESLKVCLAGNGQYAGVATLIDDGYEINGYWNHASGASIATAFTANCFIKNEAGVAKKTFIFLPDEVTVHENWNTIGMRATGSHAFEVKHLQVNKNRSFTIDANQAVLDNPIYQFPFLQLAETTIAVNSSGMAARYLDLCEGPLIAGRLRDAKIILTDARLQFYETVEQAWKLCSEHKKISLGMLNELTRVSKALAATSRKLIDELYPYSGLTAADPNTEINRVWRNLHTASQHPLLLAE